MQYVLELDEQGFIEVMAAFELFIEDNYGEDERSDPVIDARKQLALQKAGKTVGPHIGVCSGEPETLAVGDQLIVHMLGRTRWATVYRCQRPDMHGDITIGIVVHTDDGDIPANAVYKEEDWIVV